MPPIILIDDNPDVQSELAEIVARLLALGLIVRDGDLGWVATVEGKAVLAKLGKPVNR